MCWNPFAEFTGKNLGREEEEEEEVEKECNPSTAEMVMTVILN